MKLRDHHELRAKIVTIIEALECGDTAMKASGLILDAVEHAIDRRTPAAPPEPPCQRCLGTRHRRFHGSSGPVVPGARRKAP